MGKFKKDKGKKTLKADIIKPTNRNNEQVFVSIKEFQNDFECFSDWSSAEMSKFWNFNNKLHNATWQQVYSTSSTGANKRGFALTYIPKENYPSNQFINNLSEDIKMFELRVDDKMRVHGFRIEQYFYLCYLDREHKICN